MILRREYRFEASHTLPRHPGRCKGLHGHSYRFIVEVEGRMDPQQGMVMDFGDLDERVHARVIARVDHHHLNEFLENPTAEWIAIWIYRALAPELSGLRAVELFEIEGASCIYRGEDEGRP